MPSWAGKAGAAALAPRRPLRVQPWRPWVGRAGWGRACRAVLLLGLFSDCVLHSAVQTLNAQGWLHLRFYFSSEK